MIDGTPRPAHAGPTTKRQGDAIGVPNVNARVAGNSGEHPQLVAVNEHALLHWYLDTNSWPEIACRMAGSNLIRSEWKPWGLRDEPCRAFCSQ